MPPPRTLQRNAADPEQVRYAERKAKQSAERFTLGLKAVMATSAGRFVLWGLLERAGVYRSVWDANGSRMNYQAGKQDYGHELLAALIEADEDAYQLMEREMRAWQRGEAIEADALQQTRGDTGE